MQIIKSYVSLQMKSYSFAKNIESEIKQYKSLNA